MEKDLTKGPILKTLLLFALPMMLGNLLQQIYNITDTIKLLREVNYKLPEKLDEFWRNRGL